MWNHQLFFTFNELTSTLAVLANINAGTAMEPLPLVFVGSVALFYVLSSSYDQFSSNDINFQGRLHQVRLKLLCRIDVEVKNKYWKLTNLQYLQEIRDVFLMSTEILQLAIALYQLCRTAESRGMSLRRLLCQKSH